VTIKFKEIRLAAAEIGIDLVGVAPAEPLDCETRHLEEWLAAGYHGEMAWMAREPKKRSDPRMVYPEAKTVLVAAVNYFTPHRHKADRGTGKISRYAWGDDYHDILKAKLRTLLARIQAEEPAAQGKICVDTAPVMEKAWAVRAGIGWLGKHTNVITKELGSWVFIGEILLNIDVERDTAPIDDHCGSCTACLDACPTNAIVEPYVVDSARCISYATIEHRGDTLPADINGSLDGWIYGCDICQDVCPWNRFEQPTEEKRFEPRNNETSLDLASLSGMTHEEYVERFRGSAMKRAKLSGLTRNANYIMRSPDPIDQEKKDDMDLIK
jgi:epoxyqueuosine reductase